MHGILNITAVTYEVACLKICARFIPQFFISVTSLLH